MLRGKDEGERWKEVYGEYGEYGEYALLTRYYIDDKYPLFISDKLIPRNSCNLLRQYEYLTHACKKTSYCHQSLHQKPGPNLALSEAIQIKTGTASFLYSHCHR